MITTTERQENLIDQYGELINPSKARLMREAGLGIIESRREGAYVWDQSGTRYIDCRDDNCIYNVGRRNPTLIQTLKLALDEYDIGNNLFFSEPRVLLAQKLGQISPGGALTAVAYGANSGEINDFAMKLARAQTGRTKVIAMKQGDDVSALENLIDDKTAGVLLEPVHGFAGLRLNPGGYLKKIRKLCDQFGAMMIVDEIETGLGRTGKMFAVEHEEGVIPDILTLGNALSGGLYPLTAAIFKPEYLEFWNEHPFIHRSSFGGSDLGCVVGLATVEYIEKNQLASRAQIMSERFAQGFEKMISKYGSVISEFRHCSLMMAIDFVVDELGPQMSRDLSQFGVLAVYDVRRPRRMRVIPSLTITDEDVDAILDAFDQALAGCQSIMVPMSNDALEGLIRSIRA